MSEIRKTHKPISTVGELERILLDALEKIEKKTYKRETFDLVSERSINTIRDIDRTYYTEHFFSKIRIYQMYEIFYRIWFDQHLGILNLISFSSLADFESLKRIEFQHREVFFLVARKLEEITLISDSKSLYENWISVWDYALNELVGFREFNIFSNQIQDKRRGNIFNVFTSLNGEAKFRFLMLIALGIAIIVATLFLLKK